MIRILVIVCILCTSYGFHVAEQEFSKFDDEIENEELAVEFSVSESVYSTAMISVTEDATSPPYTGTDEADWTVSEGTTTYSTQFTVDGLNDTTELDFTMSPGGTDYTDQPTVSQETTEPDFTMSSDGTDYTGQPTVSQETTKLDWTVSEGTPTFSTQFTVDGLDTTKPVTDMSTGPDYTQPVTDMSTGPDYTQDDTTVPVEEDTTAPNEDDEGLSDGEIAAIVIGSVAGVALIAGAGYYFYSSRSTVPYHEHQDSPGEDLAFNALNENDVNNYGASENGTKAHNNPTYGYDEDMQSSQYLPKDTVSGTFKSTSM